MTSNGISCCIPYGVYSLATAHIGLISDGDREDQRQQERYVYFGSVLYNFRLNK